MKAVQYNRYHIFNILPQVGAYKLYAQSLEHIN